MIIKKEWYSNYKTKIHGVYYYYGYFLFGFIPIYVVRKGYR